MAKTNIEWTEKSWNPVVGCSKISPGCKNCYAELFYKRCQGRGHRGYDKGFGKGISLLPMKLGVPLGWRNPSIIFVNSMSDLFHPEVPFSFIRQVFGVIESTPRHTYQILTKHPNRMAEFFSDYSPPFNAWIGVTIENKEHGLPRLDILHSIQAGFKWVSIEPLLEDLGDINLDGINWVVVGGESGPKTQVRRMKEQWIVKIRDNCVKNKIPFYFKQWGVYGPDGVQRYPKSANGSCLQGKEWKQRPDPEVLKMRYLLSLEVTTIKNPNKPINEMNDDEIFELAFDRALNEVRREIQDGKLST